MAYKIQIQVKESYYKEFPSKYNNENYRKIFIVDTNNILYSSNNGKTICLPEPKEVLDLWYEKVNNVNYILSVNCVTKIFNEEVTEMKQKHMTNTSTAPKGNFYKVKGTLYYSFLKEPSKGENSSNKYEITLKIGDSTKSLLEDLGVQIRSELKSRSEGTIQGNFIRIKSNKQPRVSNNDTPLTDIPLVSDGSTAIITMGLVDNRESNIKQGRGGAKVATLVAVDFTNLVEYTPTEIPLLGE